MKSRYFNEMPKAYTAYSKVIKGLIVKSPKRDKVLPEVEYIVSQLSFDVAHLTKYNDICGYKNDGTVPATYIAVLAQSLQMQMMTSEAFPFALLGLVHIRNRVKQLRVIKNTETIQLSCRFGELLPHDKGLQFDFVIQAHVGQELVFEGLTTYLARQKGTNGAASKAKSDDTPNYQHHSNWKVAENTGRRYAAISGDFNLIHIHALTAKAFGFKQAIAHGLWTKAKALATIADLPNAYEADVWFKLPIFLPSEVELLTAKSNKENHFLVRNVKSHKPHLTGTIKTL